MPITPDRIAYVLSGGGAKGDFQIGALAYLYEHVSSRPDIVCGTSVGSVNATILAEGEDESFARLQEVWSRLRRNSDMWEYENGFESLQENLTTSFGGTLDWATVGPFAGPLALIGLGVWGSRTIDTLRRAKQSRSVSNIEPIRFLGRNFEGYWEPLGPGLRGSALAVGVIDQVPALLLARGRSDLLLYSNRRESEDLAPWKPFRATTHRLTGDPATIGDGTTLYGVVFRGESPASMQFLPGSDVAAATPVDLGRPDRVDDQFRWVNHPSVSGFGTDECVLMALGRVRVGSTSRQLPFARLFRRTDGSWGPWVPAGRGLLDQPITHEMPEENLVVDFVGTIAVWRDPGSSHTVAVVRGRDWRIHMAEWTEMGFVPWTPVPVPVVLASAGIPVNIPISADPTLVVAGARRWLFTRSRQSRLAVAVLQNADGSTSAVEIEGGMVTSTIKPQVDRAGLIHLFAIDTQGQLVYSRQTAVDVLSFSAWTRAGFDSLLWLWTDPVVQPVRSKAGFEVVAVGSANHARFMHVGGASPSSWQVIDDSSQVWTGVRLRQAVVSMETGNLRYVTETGKLLTQTFSLDTAPPHHPDDHREESLVSVIDGAIASSAIPVFFGIESLANGSYGDGGIRSVTPIRPAIELGAERVFAIVASNDKLPVADSIVLRELDGATATPRPIRNYAFDAQILDVAERLVLHIFLHSLQENELFPPGGWPVPVTIIRPTLSEAESHDAFLINPGTIRIAIDYGYVRAAEVVEGRPRFVQALSDQIFSSRYRAWRLESQLLALAIGGNVRPEGGGFISSPAREGPNLVDRIRDEKRILASSIRTYLDAGFSVPSTTMRSPFAWEENFNERPDELGSSDRVVAPIGPDLSFVAASPWEEMILFRWDPEGLGLRRNSEIVMGGVPPSI